MLVIGHRGDRQKYPDNILKGIASAFQRGADGVEIDVHYHQQKGAYLVHDYLHDLNKDYPSLEEFLKRFSQQGRLQIEIKALQIEAVRAIADLIKKYQPSDYELTSSISPLLKYVREIIPRAKIGLIANSLIEDWWTEEISYHILINYLKLTQANSIYIGRPTDFWSKDKVEKFHKKGFDVHSHLLTDSKENYQRFVEMGIDGCTADNLDVLQWRKSK